MTIAKAPTSPTVSDTRSASIPWHGSVLFYGLVGSLLFWVALPPCDLWWIGWVAPLPWVMLIRRRHLAGRRPYLSIWAAGLVFWLLALHWVRLPHPANYIGWLALAAYLGVYLPLFVGLARVGVHRFRMPVLLTAPVVWAGLELARGHLLSGLLIAELGHTQYRWTQLIQISDLGGEYLVSFVVMFAACCLARSWPLEGAAVSAWPVIPLVAVVAAAFGYGQLRMSPRDARPGPKVALIQGAIVADWKQDPEKRQRIVDQYLQLSYEAVQQSAGALDLIVWPETMFPSPLVTMADGGPPTGDRSDAMEAQIRVSHENIEYLVAQLGVPVLLGMETWSIQCDTTGIEKKQRFNSAVLADRTGRVVGRYDKMHLVMFGEYVPLATLFPSLYRLTPLGGGLSAGAVPQVLTLGSYRYAPTICFESVLPHKVRGSFREMQRRGQPPPEILVNLTNDAWFWGSSELDMHLACAVFRAVECRRPFLVAANSGISAWIDSDGRIRRQAPRQRTAVIYCDVGLDDRQSLYVTLGDWPAGLCLAACLGLAAAGWIGRRQAEGSTPD